MALLRYISRKPYSIFGRCLRACELMAKSCGEEGALEGSKQSFMSHLRALSSFEVGEFKERFREGGESRTRCHVNLNPSLPYCSWKPFFYLRVQGRYHSLRSYILCTFLAFLWIIKLQTFQLTAGEASDNRPSPTSAFTHRMFLLLKMWLFYTHQNPSFLSTLYVPEPTEVVLIVWFLFLFCLFCYSYWVKWRI